MGTLPHRLDVSGRPGFTEALRRTRDGVLEDYDHQDVTFPQILRALFPCHRDLSRVGFNMQISPEPASFEVHDQEKQIFTSAGRMPDVTRAKYDLLLDAREDREQIQLVLLAAAQRFHRETVAEIAADLEELILGVLHEPGAPVERLLRLPRFRHAVVAAP